MEAKGAQVTDLSIGIIGLGQIGGSLAGALNGSKLPVVIHGFDRNADLLQAATERGLISVTAHSSQELINRCQVVILATPVDSIMTLLNEHRDILSEKRLVSDTGSVKATIIKAARELGLGNFVAGHPFSGTEKRGPESWNPDLLRDKPYFYFPSPESQPQATDTLCSLITATGAKPISVDVRLHDRMVALTSGITHITALILRRLLTDTKTPIFEPELFVGPSFTDATRVVSSEPGLIRQLVEQNKTNISAHLHELIVILREVEKALNTDDMEAVFKALRLPTA